MAVELLDAERMDHRADHDSIGIPLMTLDRPALESDRPITVARGIITGVLIATPFWAVVGFTVYLLM